MILRRTFLLSSTCAALSWSRNTGENVRIGVIGVHGRGRDHIAGFQKVPNCSVVALCDVDEEVLRDRGRQFESKYGQAPSLETDLRKLLERKDIDAVSIATPNHWHALAAIWACQAGKDVYVEKPGCHNLFEGRKLIEAAHKYDRIVQHGVQLRSSPALKEAVSLLRKGAIGKVTRAQAMVYRSRHSIGKKPDSAAPEGLNYDIWQGPAQPRPFNENIVPDAIYKLPAYTH